MQDPHSLTTFLSPGFIATQPCKSCKRLQDAAAVLILGQSVTSIRAIVDVARGLLKVFFLEQKHYNMIMSIPGTYESHLTLSGLQRVVLGAIPIPSSSWRNGVTNLLRKSWGSSLIVRSLKPTGSSNQQALVKETYWR